MESVTSSILSGKDLESITYSQNKDRDNWYLSFNFKKPAIKKWADITRQNIGNSIAIMMDNQVMCAPVINSVIEGGKCQITGKFTETEVKLFTAIGNHGELPEEFKIVE